MPIFDSNLSGELQIELDEEQIQRIFDQIQTEAIQSLQASCYPYNMLIDTECSPRRQQTNYNEEFDREELEHLLRAVRYSHGMPRDVYDLLVHKLQYMLSEYERNYYNGVDYEDANTIIENVVRNCLMQNTRQFNIYLPNDYHSRPDLVNYIKHKCYKYGIDLHVDIQPRLKDMWLDIFEKSEKPKLKAGWFNE